MPLLSEVVDKSSICTCTLILSGAEKSKYFAELRWDPDHEKLSHVPCGLPVGPIRRNLVHMHVNALFPGLDLMWGRSQEYWDWLPD